ncbi:MAG: hypothetical protein HKN12_06410 [Gemmatimonadetes bacterium]|nr:hypothetical protein [Gemmatimonadota bacterium]
MDTAFGSFRLRAVPDPSKVFLGPGKVNPPPTTSVPLHDGYVGAPSFTPGVDLGTFVWRASPGGPWEIRCSSPNLNADAFDGWIVDGTDVTGAIGHDFENANFAPGRPRVWRNDGGTFAEVTSALGLPQMINPRDLSWVDYDNDGDLDLHVVDMGISALPNTADALFRNDDSVFVNVAASEGVTGATEGMGDGAVWGDTDDDGDLDCYLLEGAGPLAFSRFGPATLFRNDGAHGPALFLDLTGQAPGYAAVGARVEVIAGALTAERRVTANSWRGFQDPLRVHVGLGGAAIADTVRITWPSGNVNVLTGLPAGRHAIAETGGTVSVPLPGAPPPSAGTPSWSLGPVRPQPGLRTQTLVLRTPGPMTADISVHNVVGHRVRTLHRGMIPAGDRELAWDGRDERGRRVGAGMYWIRVSDGRTTVTRKSVRLR